MDFNGGFSKDILGNEILKKYIGIGKGVFGYIGHSIRTKNLDKYLEATFFKKFFDIENCFDVFCTWLTSTDGRDFGDSLENYSFNEQQIKIDKYINSIFEIGFIYSRPEHDGTLGSTNKLREKYNDYISSTINGVEDTSKYKLLNK